MAYKGGGRGGGGKERGGSQAPARKNLACSASYVRSGETRSVKRNTIKM